MSTPKGVDQENPKSTPSLPSAFKVYPAPTCWVDVGLKRRCSRVHTRGLRALSIGLESVPPQQVYQVYPGRCAAVDPYLGQGMSRVTVVPYPYRKGERARKPLS